VQRREQLDRALDYVLGGDTLVVTKVDRLARSTVGLWDIVKTLEAVDDGGSGLRILSLGGEVIDTRSATGRLILTIFAGFAQFEREIMLWSDSARASAKRRPPGSTSAASPALR
jgi:DNA invertase Pin-like site-specific DNA recombinase